MFGGVGFAGEGGLRRRLQEAEERGHRAISQAELTKQGDTHFAWAD